MGLPEEREGVQDEEEVCMKGTLGHLADGTALTMAGRYMKCPEQEGRTVGYTGVGGEGK